MADSIHLEVLDTTSGERSRRLTRLRDDRGRGTVEIFHEFDRIVPMDDAAVLDGHVLAVLLHACSRGADLVVHGPISRTAMRNFQELQRIRARWHPQRYRQVEIKPERVVEVTESGAGGAAISAFSGGVDACFTALRHTRLLPETIRYPLRSVLLVHGFDIPLENSDDFPRLVQRVEPILRDLQLDLRVMRTNSRTLRQEWFDSYAFQLACCLHLHAGPFSTGLIGSAQPYHALVLPGGSNPVQDHLLSGGRLSIVHDGAGFGRTAKVAALARYPLIADRIRVCWEGKDAAVNCGRCEKCIRTQLNFLAAGVPVPDSFPGGLNAGMIRSVRFSNLSEVSEVHGILSHAKAQGVTGPWLEVLERKAASLPASARRERFKQRVVKTLAQVGLDKPARLVWRTVRKARVH